MKKIIFGALLLIATFALLPNQSSNIGATEAFALATPTPTPYVAPSPASSPVPVSSGTDGAGTGGACLPPKGMVLGVCVLCPPGTEAQGGMCVSTTGCIAPKRLIGGKCV